MLSKELFALFLLAAIAHAQQQKTQINANVAPMQDGQRTARIMKILKEPAPLQKRNRAFAHAPPPPPNLQSRRERFPPPPPQPPHHHHQHQRTLPILYQRPFNNRNQILRRVQNGPQPPQGAVFHRPNLAFEPAKNQRYAPGHKDNGPLLPLQHGKPATLQRPPQFAAAPHPNAIAAHAQPQPQHSHSQQYLQNFKASPPYNGNAIIRPVTLPIGDIKQYPLPQQHTHAQQHQKQTYSVFEDPEITEHAPLPPANSQQNPLTYNPPQYPPPQQMAPVVREAEDYLKFMSTNEYFLPKVNPNYKKLDEEQDLRKFKKQQLQQQQLQQQQQQQHQQQQQQQYQSAQAQFDRPIKVSKLFFHGENGKDNNDNDVDLTQSSTIVRGSYQAGSNVFVVNSDGNKAIKHIVPSSLAPYPQQYSSSTTPSHAHAHRQTNARVNTPALRHHTPEPVRFEFTERDAVLPARTELPTPPPIFEGNYHYQSMSFAPAQPAGGDGAADVDADPEDGDDMQEAGTDFYGRVPIRNATANAINGNNKNGTASTPASEQTDTEEYCESICANVQDDNAEIICGSDGYMYTGEAQMECYASCLHIEVSIQGKGSCSAR